MGIEETLDPKFWGNLDELKTKPRSPCRRMREVKLPKQKKNLIKAIKEYPRRMTVKRAKGLQASFLRYPGFTNRFTFVSPGLRGLGAKLMFYYSSVYAALLETELTLLNYRPICWIIGQIHTHNTRYAANQNFFKPSVRTNYGVSTFKFSATKVWESVPPEVKRFPYLLFKKRYKNFLLTTQNWP